MVNATLWPLCHREKPCTHRIGGWVGPRAGLDGPGKPRPPPRFDSQSAQPVACQYTDCAISVHLRIFKKLDSVYWVDLERPAINMNLSPIKSLRSYEKRKYTTILLKLADGSYPARNSHFILLHFLISNLLQLLSLSNYLSHVHSSCLYHRLWCSFYAIF